MPSNTPDKENKDDNVSDSSTDSATSDNSSDAAAENPAVGDAASNPGVGDAATVDAGLAGPPSNGAYISEDTETAVDRKDDRENLQHLGEPKDVEIAYTISTHLDPRRQVDANGVYLDDVERRKAEVLRARAEDREPNLDNPPPIASDTVVPTVHAQPVAGAVAPVDFVTNVNVGVPQDAVDTNAAAAEAHDRKADGSHKASK